jgi:hypothetical protein
MGQAGDKCIEFRSLYDDGWLGSASDPLRFHADNCAACQRWIAQVDDISRQVAVLPQFDVSEQLTQRILADVQAQGQGQALTPANLHYALLVPVVVACLVLTCTVAPVDTLEGTLSTLLALVALAGINLLFRTARVEESAA